MVKDVHFSFLWFEIRQISNNGKVMKFIKKKLYGGRLKEVIKPKIKGIM